LAKQGRGIAPGMTQSEKGQRSVLGSLARQHFQPLKNLRANTHTGFYDGCLANDTVAGSIPSDVQAVLAYVGCLDCPDHLSCGMVVAYRACGMFALSTCDCRGMSLCSPLVGCPLCSAHFVVGWLAGSDTWDVTRVQVNVVWNVENVSGVRDVRAVRVAIGDRAAKQFEMTKDSQDDSLPSSICA